MAKITPESCYGQVFSSLKFIVENDEFLIRPKRSGDTADEWIVEIFKNGKQIVSKTCRTIGSQATNKKIFQLKEEYSKKTPKNPIKKRAAKHMKKQ